jgi:hypothetical protein
MDLPLPPDHWSIERLTDERTAAVGALGFTPRQAAFLVEVLIHSGVFVERQYCHFAAITHGQKTTDFLRRLVERGYARPIATGALHRGRLFHLHHKPMYAAIEQADNRVIIYLTDRTDSGIVHSWPPQPLSSKRFCTSPTTPIATPR